MLLTLKVMWEVQATSCNHSHENLLALDPNDFLQHRVSAAVISFATQFTIKKYN